MTETSNLDFTCFDGCLVGQALDGMCVGMVITNSAGKILWLNRAAETLMGVEKTESRGRPLSQVIKDPQLSDFWNQAVESEDAVLGEVATHWPREAHLKCNSATCVDQVGNENGRVLLFCDVTNERSVQLSLSQETTERLLNLTDSWQHPTEPTAGLTPQELRILRLVGGGLGNSEIAEEVDVAPSTVRTHLKHIYAKTGLSSRSEAISYAIQNGMI